MGELFSASKEDGSIEAKAKIGSGGFVAPAASISSRDKQIVTPGQSYSLIINAETETSDEDE
ncbi:MAG: hypothetical protein LBU32_00330 [Clostridiales bacterium]|nr:hypothetical protein [Clostridiales bacterium]